MVRDARGRTARNSGAPERARILIAGTALACLFALVLVALTAVFAADGWLPRAIVIAVGAVLGSAGARALLPGSTGTWRAGVLAAVTGTLVGGAAWAAPLVASGRLRTWLELPNDLVQQISLELTIGAAPVRPSPELGDVICTAVLLISVVVVVLFSTRALLASGITVALLLLATPIVTTRGVDPLTLVIAGLLLAVILWAGSPTLRPGGLVAAGVAVAVAAGAVSLAPPTRDRVWNSANVTAPVGSNTPDVSLALADDLRERSNTPAFSFVAEDRSPLRFTLATVADFSGGRWQPQDALTSDGLDVTVERDPAQLPPQTESTAPVDRSISLQITIDGLVSEWMPLPQSTAIVGTARGGGIDTDQWLWVDAAAAARSERSATQRGDSYMALYTPFDRFPASPRPEGGRNAANAVPIPTPETEPRITDPASAPPEMQEYLELPGEVPQSISDAAERLRVSAGSDDRLVIAETIERWFRSGAFTYDESAPSTADDDADDPYAIMETFLADRSGFCIHYASTFGVLARELGLPTRVAVGYAARAESSERTTVRGRDLHAWPEVYVTGEGWIPFEPTPGGAGFRADTGEDVPSTPGAQDPAEGPDETTTPESSPTPEEIDEPTEDEAAAPADDGTDISATGDTGAWLARSAPALAALLLLLVPAAVRQAVRLVRRRRVRQGAAPASAAWAEFRSRARDLGVERADARQGAGASASAPRARTPEAAVEYLVATGALTDSAAVGAAWALASAVTAERYGASAAPASSEALMRQCTTATAGLARASTRSRRVLAALAPASLLRRREDRQARP
ncbi:hypothetical protein K8P10_001310 [Leucobacter sp. Psy1]|uniref:DUF3488 and transglutaminase-like domain-containing protein n=1 Tax=Leucobacter sp. Psy1 TaxID=2875729 RepID=UPI001CD397F8|nr:transglutaminase domain-containing protein [Leucobacter sp. Psy1]UBH05799.1 hypothetical protein K8P10_001310 [Leucobacter sp. Psy1]